MSEIKAQLLGMTLVLAAFGAIIGILIPSFKANAENVNKQITIDGNGSVTYNMPAKTSVTL
mgnify:CR=1 FL=1